MTLPFPQNSHLPMSRSKESPRCRRIWIRVQNRAIQVIHIVIRHTDPPPARHACIGQIDCQNDNDSTDSKSCIQASRGNIIEPHPPAPVLVSDVLVERKAHDTPGQIVERSSRWNLTTAAVDERCREVPERHFGKHAGKDVDQHRGKDTSEPEPLQVGVYASWREDALRTDQAPDDGGVEKDTPIGTIEFVGLVFGTDVCDCSTKGPLKYTHLDDTGPECCNSLGHEHRAWWNLHILSQFEVLREI